VICFFIFDVFFYLRLNGLCVLLEKRVFFSSFFSFLSLLTHPSSLSFPPQRGLLERFQLKEFESLVAALRDGDFRLYQEQLDRYQDEFIARGVYIILEKLKLFVYRNFFKKMYVRWEGREGGRKGREVKVFDALFLLVTAFGKLTYAFPPHLSVYSQQLGAQGQGVPSLDRARLSAAPRGGPRLRR